MEEDIRIKIERAEYDNPLEYPKIPSKPFLKHGHTSEEASAYAQQLLQWEEDMKKHKKRIKDYRAASNKLHEKFKTDALEYVGLTGHPKADRAWHMALDQARGDGLEAVVNVLEEYADLLL